MTSTVVVPQERRYVPGASTGALEGSKTLFGSYGVGVRFAEPTEHELNTKRLSSDVGGLRKGKSSHGTYKVYINFDLMLLTWSSRKLEPCCSSASQT